MDYLMEICHLTDSFLHDYPESKYPELMYKKGRPYTCLLIKTHYDYFICLPFRSSIQHKYAYMFKSSERSRTMNSGIDYSKAVIIRETKYLSDHSTVVDDDEYKEAITHMDLIVDSALEYIEDYIRHVKGIKLLHDREFERRYRYSTLPYFHDLLGL